MVYKKSTKEDYKTYVIETVVEYRIQGTASTIEEIHMRSITNLATILDILGSNGRTMAMYLIKNSQN